MSSTPFSRDISIVKLFFPKTPNVNNSSGSVNAGSQKQVEQQAAPLPTSKPVEIPPYRPSLSYFQRDFTKGGLKIGDKYPIKPFFDDHKRKLNPVESKSVDEEELMFRLEL